MPNTVPNVTVSESNFANIVIPLNTEPRHSFELGHDYVLTQTDLKELMNRIYKLELDVYVLKQQIEHGGTIRL